MMKAYYVAPVSLPVCWEAIDAVPLLPAWRNDAGIRACAKLCRSETTLHIRLEAWETEIRAGLTDPLAMVCDDSCLEFFFAPMAEDARYFNIECNPLGTVYFGFGTGRQDQLRLIPQDARTLLNIQTWYTESGWGVCFDIPYALIRLFFPDYQPVGTSRGNFFKCGEKTTSPHHLSWNPMSSDFPDFHRSQDFGLLVYDET